MNTQVVQPNTPGSTPLGREFAVYIKGQYAGHAAGLYAKPNSSEDINDYEEPIMVRSFFYRLMRTAFLRNGQTLEHDNDFVSHATARRWAALDAVDFRNLNRINRDVCTHCAALIRTNPSPFYLRAMQLTAPDVLEMVHAAARTNHEQRRAKPAPADSGQGVLSLPAQQAGGHPASNLVLAQRPRQH